MFGLVTSLKFIPLKLVSLALHSNKFTFNITDDPEQMPHSILQQRPFFLQLLMVSINGVLRLFDLLQASIIPLRDSIDCLLAFFQESFVAFKHAYEMSRSKLQG